VDGVEIHFWHVRGEGPKPFPLLLLHGWPGSIYEFYELIGPLAADGFDVVVPALPGFGFGGQPRERGWGIARIAEAFNTLMCDELGYDRYGVQGGDWGGIIAARLGATRAGSVAGIHVNLASAGPPPNPTPEDEAARQAIGAFRARESGYSAVQATKPDSLTIAQTDSPAGLAAWIVEKFRSWSGCGGDVERSFSKDVLLTNLMFYWAPASVASSARIYYEWRSERELEQPHVGAPTAVAVFPDEPFRAPRRWVERAYNVVRWSELPRGGHFAALEEPELLLGDVRGFFQTIR
jgi:microsomal epoxide hydrolase